MFLVWMWAGDWGAPPRPIRPDASPVSQYVFAPYAVVCIGAGVVTAPFMGSMIFLSLERGRGMERGRVMELATVFGAAAVLAYLAVLTAVNLYAIDNRGNLEGRGQHETIKVNSKQFYGSSYIPMELGASTRW